MCGPSSQMESAQSQTASMASTLSANYNQYFASQSSILGNLTNMLTPIAQAGPDQQGFGANELVALSTAANQGVGQNYAKATQALNNQLAAQGGGNSAATNFGAKAALQGQLAASAANQMSSQQAQLTEANYATGRNNYQSAVAGLSGLASQYNAGQIGSEATSALGQSFSEANTIQQQKNQEQADIAGGIAGLATGVATGGLGGSLLGAANDNNFLSSLGGGKIFGSGGLLGG